MHLTLSINGREHSVDVPPDMPLLWILRDILDLKATKYGCGIGQCGACTVHLNGVAVRSCQTPAVAAAQSKVTTLEGLPEQPLSALQAAWERQDVPQCGYCQVGQLMTATALLSKNPHPTDEEIAAAMSGNYCRCGTYVRINRAVKEASASLRADAAATVHGHEGAE